MVFYSTVDELRQFLRPSNSSIPLDIAALWVAAVEYPDLTEESRRAPFLELLDSHARELGEITAGCSDGEAWVRTANSYLFENLGFAGNQDDYYAAANSCLNDVLMTRTGLPITLAVVFMEIARRLGKRADGIGLPGHFVVLFEDGDYRTFVDCFHGGRLLDAGDCHALALEVAGVDITHNPGALEPIPPRNIVFRMLHNLRNAYHRASQPAKAVRVLDLLIEAEPAAATLVRERGDVLAHLGRHAAALADWERYLKLVPNAPDAAAVRHRADAVRRSLRSLN
ncbi:MAG: transglutaminase-like domain-containing protein [Bryobacteraceae bacterium]